MSFLDISHSPSLVTLISPLKTPIIESEVDTKICITQIDIDTLINESVCDNIVSTKLHHKLSVSECETSSDGISYESCSEAATLDRQSASPSPSYGYIKTRYTSVSRNLVEDYNTGSYTDNNSGEIISHSFNIRNQYSETNVVHINTSSDHITASPYIHHSYSH